MLALTLLLGALVTSTSAKTCLNMTIPVPATARTGAFNLVPPVTNLEATTFIQNLDRQGRNYTDDILTGYRTTSGTYNIKATFCKPSGKKGSAANPTIQLLTHGIGFDRSYWDLPFHNYNYSYVDVATDSYGYYTLAYDRLGIAQSQHAKFPADTVQTIQAALEVEVLHQLTLMTRGGKLPEVSTAFKKVVHVGHSFGSGITYALTSFYPTISNGIVLTGFSLNSSFIGSFLSGGNFQQATLNQPQRLGRRYIRGYLVNANIGTLQFLFLLPGYFDPLIEVFGENTKQPVTTGELLTLGSVPKSSTFKKPVMVFTGSNDLPFCGGDCLNTGGVGTSVPDVSTAPAFPMAKPYKTYIQPNTGHGLNFHYNATAGYGVVNSFFTDNGLASS